MKEYEKVSQDNDKIAVSHMHKRSRLNNRRQGHLLISICPGASSSLRISRAIERRDPLYALRNSLLLFLSSSTIPTMTSTQAHPSSSTDTAAFTSIDRVAQIPLVESGISTLHSTLSNTPLIRTPYNISLSISSSLKPYVASASTHYPFAPFLTYGDRAANKTLDIAQEKFPYAFQSKPEQVWDDVRSVADERVIKPAYNVAKTVDQVCGVLS